MSLELFDKYQISKGILCGGCKRKKLKHYCVNVFKGSKWASICREISCERYVNDHELRRLSERMT